jgi:polysaccharide biosynthesis protein PslA
MNDSWVTDLSGVEQQIPAQSPPQAAERRSPTRRGSRGDKHRLSPTVVVNLVQAGDILLLLSCGLLTRAMVEPAMESDGSFLLATLTATLITAWLLTRSAAYGLPSLRSLGRQIMLLALSLLGGSAGMIVVLFLTRQDGRLLPFVWLSSGAAMLFASRCTVSPLLIRLSHTGRLARRVAVIGTGDFSRVFIERLRTEPDFYTVVGLYDDRVSRAPAVQDGVRVRGSVQDLLARSRQEQIDVIVIALPLQAISRISMIMEQIGSAVADVCLTTDFVGFRYRSSQISSVGSNPVVLIGERPLKDWRAAKKAAFDWVIGSLMLVTLSPLLALIALAIRVDSPGPIVFRQPRMGFNNRLFTCYKFRTMHHAMADLTGDQQATRGDARITRVGKWLRALSLDELPQLLNVFKGDMSLVGPRPHPPNTKAEDKLYADVVAKYAFRHRVKPGMTGWAQVNGWRGETRTLQQIENRVACDLAYIENWSMWFDLRILVLTLTREILSRNAF